MKNVDFETIYTFPSMPGLIAFSDGTFEYNGRPTRKVYNNGSISVLCGKSKRGIIALRKEAVKKSRKIVIVPF